MTRTFFDCRRCLRALADDSGEFPPGFHGKREIELAAPAEKTFHPPRPGNHLPSPHCKPARGKVARAMNDSKGAAASCA